MTTTQQPTFDYGEPWGFDGENWITDARNKEILNLDSIHSRNARRLIDCVNACQKMAEPAAEIAAMREAIKKGYDALTKCVDDSGELLAERGWWRDEPRCGYQARYDEHKQRIEDAEAALTKLKLFIKP